MTSFAEDSGWVARVTIATNGDFSEICVAGVGVEGDKEYGRMMIKDGFLTRTVTNENPHLVLKLPYTARERIIQADGQMIFLSDGPSSYEFLLQKETE